MQQIDFTFIVTRPLEIIGSPEGVLIFMIAS